MASDSNKGMVKPIKASVTQSDYDWIDLDKVSSIRFADTSIYFDQKNGEMKQFAYYNDPSKRDGDFEQFSRLFKGETMLKTIGSDMKAFIAEHKSTIYCIAVLFLVDHVFFQGAFRERLHGMMNKFLGKVEAQIDGKPVTLVPEKQA